MKHLVSVTLLAFLGTAALFAIPKNSQAITTPQNLFAEQISTTLTPNSTQISQRHKPKPKRPRRHRF